MAAHEDISTFIEIAFDEWERSRYFDDHRSLEAGLQAVEAISALGALAHEHRLTLFRLLVRAGEKGLPAGAIAAELGIPNSSLSFHLSHLNQAGLVKQERQGRSLVYSADYAAMNALVGYLMENCCAGRGGCEPIACEVQPSDLERVEA